MSRSARRRVVIDASAAFNQGAGIGRYARNVIPAAALALPNTSFGLFYAPARPGPAPFGADALARFPRDRPVTIHRAPMSRRRADQLWFRAGVPFPLQAFTGPADVIYSPDFTAPPARRVPRLVTVHDLAFLIFPEHTQSRLRSYLEHIVPRQVATAHRVIVVSETTKSDLIERLGLREEQIVVVPNGVEERFFAATPLTVVDRESLSLPEEYLLTVGTVQPRKNHLTLFAAMRLLGGRLDVPLVVAGRRGWDVGPIVEASEDLVHGGRVRFVDYVPDALLPGLYAGATAVVYPSWYEGFGLPVLEALATGVPTVTSDAPALVEVGGEVTIVSSAGRADDLAVAIERALTPMERSAPRREERQRQARRYSWEAAGGRLASLIREVTGAAERSV